MIIVDYRPGMVGLTGIYVYETTETTETAGVKMYQLSNDWNKFKDALTDLCYAEDNFDVVFYGNTNTIPYTEDELKQEFKDFEHKKYANAANLNIRIEVR